MTVGFVLIRLRDPPSLDAIKRLAALPFLSDVHHLYGDFDVLAKLERGNDPVQTLSTITDLPGIESAVFLATVKHVGDATATRTRWGARVTARGPLRVPLPA